MDRERTMRIVRPSLVLVALAATMVLLGGALTQPAEAVGSSPVQAPSLPAVGATDPTQPLVKAGEDVLVPAGATAQAAVAFGGDVTVDGSVTDAAVAFGGDVVVNGSVGSSVVAFGGDVTVKGSVGASVVAFGGDVRLLPGSVVGTSMKASDKSVVLFGGKLTRDPSAQVTGATAVYDNANWAEAAGWFSNGVGKGLVQPWGGLSFLGWVIQAAVFLVLGLVAAALLPKQMRAVQRKLAEKTAASLGWGALAFFVIAPAVLVVLVISVVGLLLVLPYAVFLALFYFFVITSVAALVAGLLLRGTRHADNLVLAVVLGVLATTVVSKIPVAGFIVLVAMAVFGAGAAVLAYGEHRRARRAAMTPAPAGGPAWPAPAPGTAVTVAAAQPAQPPAYAPGPPIFAAGPPVGAGAEATAATTAAPGGEYWPSTPPLPPETPAAPAQPEQTVATAVVQGEEAAAPGEVTPTAVAATGVGSAGGEAGTGGGVPPAPAEPAGVVAPEAPASALEPLPAVEPLPAAEALPPEGEPPAAEPPAAPEAPASPAGGVLREEETPGAGEPAQPGA